MSGQALSVIDRLKLTIPLYAVFILCTGILDAFVQMPTLDYLVFHSALFHLGVFVVFLFLGPFVAKAIGLKLDKRATNERA